MKYFINFLLVITFICNVVFPNSFQTLSIALLVLVNIFIIITYKIFNSKIYSYWFFLSIIFILYIYISAISSNHKIELIFKYCISPILWINIFMYVFKFIKTEIFVKWGVLFFLIANLSVIFLYILTTLGYVNLTGFFIETVNINQNTGLGFTLHVYGSLIFYSIALIPILRIVSNPFYKYLLVISLLIAIILSGRTALYLSLALSVLYFAINYKKIKFKPKLILSIIVLIIGLIVTYKFVYNEFFEKDLFEYISETHLEKLSTVGGTERSVQIEQITQAIKSNPLGNGFISLQKTRDLSKPFNYEVLILSTIMRFGVPVFLLLLFSIKDLLNFFNKKNNSDISNVFFLGFVGIIIASFTNPYLESFCFQWMFFGPIVYFNLKNESNIFNKI